MKSIINSLSVLAFFMLSAAACKEDGMDNLRLADLDKEFNISFNQEVYIRDENLKLNFAQVNANSLCPVDVECVWQGQLVITLKVNGQDVEISLGDNATPEKTVGNYHITLVELVAPVPKSDENAELSDYVVTLLVEQV